MFLHHFNGFAIRGEFDDNRTLWIPAEDVARIRGIDRIHVPDLRRAGMRDGIDFMMIDARSELGCNLHLNYTTGNPRRLVFSEAGMYMLMMSGRGKADMQLKYWLADEVIPAIRSYGEYNLPADHPIYGVLAEVSQTLSFYKMFYDNPDQTLGDLAGRDYDN